MSLVLLSNSFWEEPIEDRKVNVHGLELVAVKLQVLRGKAVFKAVELDESSIAQGNSEVLSGNVPDSWNCEGMV